MKNSSAFLHPPASSTLSLVVSCPDSRLGEIFVAVAQWCALGSAIADCKVELAALRASKWTAPTFEVVIPRSISRTIGRKATESTDSDRRLGIKNIGGAKSKTHATDGFDLPFDDKEPAQPLGRYAARIETLPDRCKHGLNFGCCGTCVRLAQSGQSKQRSNQKQQFPSPAGDIRRVRVIFTINGWDSQDVSECYYSRSRDGEVRVCLNGSLFNVSPSVEYLPECLRWVEPKAAPYDPAWDELRSKVLQEKFAGHTNFCPTCKMHVADNHDASGNLSCEDHLSMLAAKLQKRAAKVAKTLEEYCARDKAKRQRKLLDARRLRQQFVFSSDEFDRDILKSRGSVTAEAVKQFDRDFLRKGNKYRVR